MQCRKRPIVVTNVVLPVRHGDTQLKWGKCRPAEPVCSFEMLPVGSHLLRVDVFNDLKGAAKVFLQTCRSNPKTPFVAQKRSSMQKQSCCQALDFPMNPSAGERCDP